MKLAVYVLMLLGAKLALAQFSTPAEGEYVINDGMWGALEVQAGGKFELETTGANAHLCGLQGAIINGRSQIGASACQVSFKAEGQDIRVAALDAVACSSFCGAGARFEGLYRKPSPLCTREGIAEARKKFKKNYAANDYAAALAAIQPVAAQCRPFLHWLESAWTLNELAVAQFKLGDGPACLRTLQELAPDAAKSDEDITGSRSARDSALYLPVVRATRANLKLCAQP